MLEPFEQFKQRQDARLQIEADRYIGDGKPLTASLYIAGGFG